MNIKFGEFQLRDYCREDADSIVKYADNKKVWQNLRDSFPHPYTKDDAEYWISVTFTQDPTVNFAIADDKELIGGIGLTLQDDVNRKTAEVGFWLAEEFWGKGIMTEALRKFTRYSFENYDIFKIFAGVFETNKASMRVFEKCGYKLEGVLRNHIIKEDQVFDQLMYGILKEEVFHPQ